MSIALSDQAIQTLATELHDHYSAIGARARWERHTVLSSYLTRRADRLADDVRRLHRLCAGEVLAAGEISSDLLDGIGRAINRELHAASTITREYWKYDHRAVAGELLHLWRVLAERAGWVAPDEPSGSEHWPESTARFRR